MVFACVEPPAPRAAYAVVVEASVSTAGGELGDTPVTTARLRFDDGATTIVRVVGGPNRFGGYSWVPGRAVPVVGQRVRGDLVRDGHAGPSPDWTRGTPPGTWASTAFPVSFTLAVDAAGSASRDLGLEAKGELDVALRAWPRVACTSWRSALAGTSTTLVPGDDGVNGVFWHDAVWPAELVRNALAQTVLSTDAGGNLRDADIHVNGADYSWSLDGAGSTIDARSILIHELGHALGLGHSADPRATMFATHPPGISWRSLEQDDRDGVCALYPGSGAPGCETAPGCPNGFICVARVCERSGAHGEVCSPCARVPGACDGAGDDARCVDIGSGTNAGRVCGRACAVDGDCGPRFQCLPTTSSGDVQCVPTDGCASGPDPCSTEADCHGANCRGGACLGAPEPTAPDAGTSADASPDASHTPVGSSGGCAVGARGEPSLPAFTLALALAAARRRPTSRRPTSRC